jgi:hypothetical protein
MDIFSKPKNQYCASVRPSHKVYKLRFLLSYMTLVLGSLILLPTLSLLPGLPGLRLEDFLLTGFPLVVLVLFRECQLDFRIWILFLIGLAFFLGFAAGALIGLPTKLQDLFFVIRILKYIGAVCLAISFVMLVGKDRALFFFFKTSLILGFMAVLIALQQYFDLGGLNSKYTHVIAPTQFETLVNGYRYPRPVGMVGNPNEFGYLLVLCGLSGLCLWLTIHKVKIIWKFLTLAILAASVLTMSRSAIFSGLIAICVFFIGSAFASFSFARVTISRRIIMRLLTILLFLLAIIMIYLKNNTLFVNITFRFTPEHFASYAARKFAWTANYEVWQQSIIFGAGPLRHGYVFIGGADNEYYHLLRTGGIVLCVLVLLLLTMGVVKKGLNPINRVFQAAIVISVLAYMVVASAFYSLVIFPWLLIFLVIIAPMPIERLRV